MMLCRKNNRYERLIAIHDFDEDGEARKQFDEESHVSFNGRDK